MSGGLPDGERQGISMERGRAMAKFIYYVHDYISAYWLIVVIIVVVLLIIFSGEYGDSE